MDERRIFITAIDGREIELRHAPVDEVVAIEMCSIAQKAYQQGVQDTHECIERTVVTKKYLENTEF